MCRLFMHNKAIKENATNIKGVFWKERLVIKNESRQGNRMYPAELRVITFKGDPLFLIIQIKSYKM